MDVKAKTLLSLMKDNDYFKDLNSYLKEMIEENKLLYNELKYLYNKLYFNKSLYLRKNIFPVSQFLINGHSTEEAEKIANLLPDAHKLTVFCYDKREKGYVYNKLFSDLRFVYMQYDEYVKKGYGKDIAFEIVKNDIQITTVNQREIEVRIIDHNIYTKEELEKCYDEIYENMHKLENEFEQNTRNDKNLLEHFRDYNPERKFSSIMVAGGILGGIDLRNICRENGSLDGEKEVFPYNTEQIEMIDKYYRLQDTLDRIESYAEYILEDEQELE